MKNTFMIEQYRFRDISDYEAEALQKHKIEACFLHSRGAILWLFKFYNSDGDTILVFDAPFDARLIHAKNRQLYDIDHPEQRLLIDPHAVDGAGIVRALRALTLPPALTLEFLSAVQDQLASNEGDQQMQNWMKYSPEHLADRFRERFCQLGQ